MFFFFQAEDGIRDYKVTGVQTCALPISSLARRRAAPAGSAGGAGRRARRTRAQLRERRARPGEGDRKSVEEGKSVDLGGRRIIKKKKKKGTPERTQQRRC